LLKNILKHFFVLGFSFFRIVLNYKKKFQELEHSNSNFLAFDFNFDDFVQIVDLIDLLLLFVNNLRKFELHTKTKKFAITV